MSPRALLLAVSLAANAALAFALAGRPAARALFSSAPAPAAASTATAKSPPSPPIVIETESWSSLATGDLVGVVVRLRAGGISNRFLRVIVGALVAGKFAGRHQAIVAAMTAKPWWQGGVFDAYSDPQITALRRALARDERDLLYRLLGPQTPENDYDRAYAARKYGPLTPDQTEKFRQINSDYDDLMAEVRDQAHGIILPGDREKLAYLEQEKRRDIAQLLTPDELLEFEMRSGPTANRLRNQLATFDPTEEEFRAIFKIQQTVDAQFGDGRVQNLTQEQRRQRRDLSNATGEQIRAVLSPERFADYQLKTDPAYLPTNQFVASLQLPPTATAQIVAVQKDVTARMQAAVADRSLTGPQRTAAFSALAAEATGKLTATLGESGLAAYKQSAGNWLNSLEQRAQSRPAVPPAAGR